MKKSGLQKVREKQRFPELIEDFKSRKFLTDEDIKIVIAWLTSAYEIGLRDAGEIIGRNISNAINKQSKDNKKR